MGSLVLKKVPMTYDFFDRLEDVEITLCKANREELSPLKIVKGTGVTLNLSSPDELRFSVFSHLDGVLYEPYSLVEAKLVVKVNNLGYFLIKNVTIKNNGEYSTKEVSCTGYEAALGKKDLVLMEGLFSIGDVLSAVSAASPTWSVGVIDPLLLGKERYFDFVTQSAYDFLMTTASEAFECLFTFNTNDLSISATAFESVGNLGNVLLGYNNAIKILDLTEDSDNLTTALSVLGSDNLDIRLVNPNGTNTIYDFGYYVNRPDHYNFMSTALRNKIIQYEIDFDSKQDDYGNLIAQYEEILFTSIPTPTDAQMGIIQLNSAISEVEALLEIKESIVAERIRGNASYADINLEIATLSSRLNTLKGYLSSKNASLSSAFASLDAINNFLRLETYFGALMPELDNIIFSGVYNDDNFLVTDSMTPLEIKDISQTLYDKGVGVLGRVSRPKIGIQIDGVDFISNIKLKDITSELVLGNTILVQISEDEIKEVRLIGLTYEFNSDRNSLKLTFSEYYKNYEGAFGFQDLITSSISAATSLSYNSSSYENWSTSYKSSVAEFITGSLNASVNQIKSNSNNEVSINQNGIRGKKWDGIGGYDPHEIWIVNNMIAFSDDNFETAKMAIGQIPDPLNPGNTLYGVIADTLVGRMIIGEALGIENSSGSFKVDNDGVTITDLDMTLTSSNSLRRIVIDPETGIVLSSRPTSGSVWSDKFYMDGSGNLNISGNLVAATGTFAGLVSGGSINIGSGKFLVDSAGTLTATGANISGSINLSSGSSINWTYVNTDPVASSASSTASSAYGAANALANGTASPLPTATFINGTTISAPNITGGVISGGRFQGLGQDSTYAIIGLPSGGNLGDFTLIRGANGGNFFRIYDTVPGMDLQVANSTGDGWTSFLGSYNGTSYAYGEWSFSSATVTGLTATAVFG